jgi:hypothetical protein
MSSNSSEAADQEPAGGFVTAPTAAVSSAGGCCGEPADATGAVPGGQNGGCCGEPVIEIPSVPAAARGCCGESGKG